jgi:diketogulonate reductase-like aldo/keto reductase
MILKAWGDWALFQSLLAVLRVIGDRHGGLSIANIAMRWVLDHSFVGAVIIGRTIICCRSGDLFYFSSGARLGVSEHTDDNDRVFGFTLDEEDNHAIEAVQAQSSGRRMITTVGDCGAEYR